MDNTQHESMAGFPMSNESSASTVITFTHWLANHCPKYDILDIFWGFSIAAMLVLFALRRLAALSAIGSPSASGVKCANLSS